MSSRPVVKQVVGDRHEVHWLYCVVFELTDQATIDRKIVLERIVRAGLRVEQFTSVKDDHVFVKIGATDDRLLAEAELSEFLLPLDADALQVIAAGTDHRDDVISRHGKVIKTVRRTRLPLQGLITPHGRQFVEDLEEGHDAADILDPKVAVVPNGKRPSVFRRPSLVEVEADGPARILNEQEINRVQGNLTRYRPFDHLFSMYDEGTFQ
jgi:hypothetical protein